MESDNIKTWAMAALAAFLLLRNGDLLTNWKEYASKIVEYLRNLLPSLSNAGKPAEVDALSSLTDVRSRILVLLLDPSPGRSDKYPDEAVLAAAKLVNSLINEELSGA